MAWDFETEPEYEAKLAWARAFVDEEILPLETLDLDYDDLLRAIRPLQDEVKRQGLWAAHLPPELGGMGFGQVRLGLLHEVLGRCFLAPVVFGNNAPDSGNAELLAVGIEANGRDEQRTAVARAAPGGQAPQRLLHDRARGRRRPHPDRHHGGARRRASG